MSHDDGCDDCIARTVDHRDSAVRCREFYPISAVDLVISGIVGQCTRSIADCDCGDNRVARAVDHCDITAIPISAVDFIVSGIVDQVARSISRDDSGDDRIGCTIDYCNIIASTISAVDLVVWKPRRLP